MPRNAVGDRQWCANGCVARALKNSDICRKCWQRWWEGLFK